MTEHQMTLEEGFGNAVRTNMAAQIIDPEAGSKTVPVATADGQKTEKTLKEYRTGKVKPSGQRFLLEAVKHE